MTGPALDKIAPPTDYEDLMRLIHDSFEGMRKTCQRIALFLTQNPNDVAVNSANATAERIGNHASVTDAEARLYKKSPGSGAMLCFMGHSPMENRNRLIVQAQVTQADGRAERKAALAIIHRHSPGLTRRLTLGSDRGYDSADFVADLQQA